MTGGNLLLVDYSTDIQFLGHVDVVYVLNLGNGLCHSEALGGQTGQNIGLGVVGQGDKSFGMLYTFAHEQARVTSVTVYYHHLVIYKLGKAVASVKVTLNYL